MLRVWLKSAYSLPENVFLGRFDPLNVSVLSRPQKAPMVVKTRRLSHCALKSFQKCD